MLKSLQQLLESGFLPKVSFHTGDVICTNDLHYTMYSVEHFQLCPLYLELIEGKDYCTFVKQIQDTKGPHAEIIGVPRRESPMNENRSQEFFLQGGEVTTDVEDARHIPLTSPNFVDDISIGPNPATFPNTDLEFTPSDYPTLSSTDGNTGNIDEALLEFKDDPNMISTHCLNSTNHHKEYPIQLDQNGDTNLSLALQKDETEKVIEDIRTVKANLCDECFHKYINNVNRNQRAPIHFATYLRNEKVLTELLKLGADISLQDNKSNTAFHLIIKRSANENEAIQLLMIFFQDGLNYTKEQYKDALDKRNNDGKAPIHLANKLLYKKVIQFMVQHGAYINRRDTYDRRTCVVKSARDNCWDMVTYLQSIGACLNTAPATNTRAIHHACMQNNMEAVKFLIEHGAELNQKTSEARTEKQLTDSEEIKDVVSKELHRRRKERSKLKQKDKLRTCKCGSNHQVICEEEFHL